MAGVLLIGYSSLPGSACRGSSGQPETRCPEVRCPEPGQAGPSGQSGARPPEQALQDRRWRQAAALDEPRELPRLARLGDAIIVVGGGSEMRATALKTTELYDPATRKWRPGPALKHARRDAELVTLRDGRLLAIGGSDGPTRTGTPHVEALAPGGKGWMEVARMKEPRIGHTAVVLSDGRVLVVGGQARPDAYLATAEIFDPATGKWKSVDAMKEARSVHHSRLLEDGRVLVMGGGTDSSATDSVEIFDPKSETWRMGASMKEPRWGFASAVLQDGRVVVAGGRIPARKGSTLPDDKLVILRGVEIYDPAADAWSDGPSMNLPRTMGLSNVELIEVDGGLLFIGGRSYPAPYHGVASAELLDANLERWRMAPGMAIGRSYQASIRLAPREILVVGGRGPQFLPLAQVESLEPRRE